MKTSNNQFPPALALSLLSWLLPDDIKDDIAGDLIEEFNKSDRNPVANQWWFWQQTISTCWRYSMTRQRIAALGLAIASLFIFLMMTTAVTFLAYGDGAVYQNDYWTTGSIHQFFAEPVFWESMSNGLIWQGSVSLYMNIPSLLWAVFGLGLLFMADKKHSLSMKAYSFAAMALITMPYLFGVVYFNVNTVPLNQAGPIIAFMWLPVVFLIIPLGFGLIKKVQHKTQLTS